MSGHYRGLGVEFLYPENWLITDEDAGSEPRTVSVQNADGAFWSLLVSRDGDPSTMAEEVMDATRGEYEDFEAHAADASFGSVNAAGYEMTFYCLDFLVAARVFAARLGSATYLLIWQAEDRDFDRLEQVFRAISTSLFEHLTSAPSVEGASQTPTS